MATRILFYLDNPSVPLWVGALNQADPSVEVRAWPDWGEPDDMLNDGVDTYAFVWEAKPGILAKYKAIKAIFSLGAGIDHLTSDPDLPTDTPIIRMNDEGLKEGMAEFCVMSALMLQRGMLPILKAQSEKKWERFFAPAASATTIGIMGYGALGQRVASAFKPFGHPINTWSTSPKPEEDSITHYAGLDHLDAFLRNTSILIGLLPDTEATRGLLNTERLKSLPRGAGVINAGRGGLIVMDDLLALMETKHIGGAVLDVFTQEPLPQDHPAWTTENLIVTPHVAAITRPDTAARFVLAGIDTLKAGKQPDTLLIRERGY